MNNDYKKGFLEAIDGVLEIIIDAGSELDKSNKIFKSELQKLENSVLNLKISFFESYLEDFEPELEEENHKKEKE